MKRIAQSITLVLLMFAALAANCQKDIYYIKYQSVDDPNANPPTYNESEEFEMSDITSDYGRRNCEECSSQWHRGIDYNLNSPVGDHILSINDAIVQKIGAGAGYKYIITGGDYYFGYGHIFEHGAVAPPGMECGDMVLKKMYLVDEYAIINLTSMTAIGRTAGLTNPVVEYPEGSGQFISVTDEVDPDEPIAILGNSGTGVNNVHLHLYMFYDVWLAIQNIGNGGHNDITNDRDPMHVLYHPNTAYSVNIETNDLIINGQNFIVNDKVVFAGDESISLKVQYTMNGATPSGTRFTDAVMDIDNVGLYIKQDYLQPGNSQNWGSYSSSCQLIRGEFAESFLSHGARMNSEIQPIKANSTYGFPANPQNNTAINMANDTYGLDGSTTRTGIDPYAYREGNNQPYDDYYFSDFYTRVHKDYQLGGNHEFADANREAKYKDGKYQLFAKVTTVRGAEYTSIDNSAEPSEIIIDNFRPIIEKVKITQVWQLDTYPVYMTIYDSEWEFEEGAPGPGTFTQSILEQRAAKPTSTINIELTTSEPLEYCNLAYFPLSNSISQTEVDASHTIWKYELSVNDIPPPGFYTLSIVGKDMAGNFLQSNPATVPIRKNPSNKENWDEWEPEPCPGADENHTFEISNCMLAFIFDPEIIPAGEESIVNITNLTSGYDEENYEWHWLFGNAYTEPIDYIGKNPPQIIYNNINQPDEYTIQLQLKSDGALVDHLIKYIQVIDPETYLLVDFEATATSKDNELFGNSPFTVQFSDVTSGNPDSWLWDFGDFWGESTDQNPEYTFVNNSTSHQQYAITLEACNSTTECSAEIKEAFITVYPENTSLDPVANFTITQSSLFAPCTVYLSNNSAGEIDTYEWDLDGDGQFNESNLEHPEPVCFNSSQYINLSLKVTNISTQISNTYSVALNIYANPNSGYTVDFDWNPIPAVQGELIHFNEEITGFYYSYNCIWKIYGPYGYYHDSYLNNPSISFFESGNYSIYLEAYDFYGNFLGVCSKQVQVNPPGLTVAPEEISIGVNHNSHFGNSVAIDGDFAVVAARNYFDKGAIFIYKYNHLSESWTLFQGPLLPDVDENDMFASSVAISGNYIAVGAPNQSNDVERNGAVYTYAYNGSLWQLQSNKLVPADATFNDGCGWDLAMDGNYLVVGTSGGVVFPDSLKDDPNNRDHAGKAYIYKNENGTWIEKCKIFDEKGFVNDGFGESVSISSTKIAVGSSHGKAFVFDRVSDNNWEQKTISAAQTGILQVSVSQNSLIIGNNKQLYNGAWNGGTAYIYNYENGAWGSKSNLIHSTEEYAHFGYSVCMDGNYAIVGAPGENAFDQEHSGASYIYRRNDVGDWHLLEKITPAFHPDVDYQNTNFGQDVFCNTKHIILSRAGCNGLPGLDCNPTPDDFQGAVTILSNYIYPCDRVIYEDNYHPAPGNYPENSASQITLGGNSDGEVYFQEDVDIAYLGSDIYLLDGFTAELGSSFVAKGIECQSLPTKALNVFTGGSYNDQSDNADVEDLQTHKILHYQLAISEFSPIQPQDL